jgi:hypothetical protein
MDVATDSPFIGPITLETRIPWPGQPPNLQPRADISGQVSTGEILVVEIDDHADPTRSVVKYWPLLHSIAFAGVSRRDDTFGAWYQFLAQFIWERFAELYPGHFRYRHIDLDDRDPHRIGQAILAFLCEGLGDRG